MVLVGASSGVVNVQVQVYEQPVTSPDTTGWDEVVDHSIESVSGQMQVAAMMDDPPDLPLLTPFGPGHYRVRVHARGRDRGYDAVAFEPAEDYLLQIWLGHARERHRPPAHRPVWAELAQQRHERTRTIHASGSRARLGATSQSPAQAGVDPTQQQVINRGGP